MDNKVAVLNIFYEDGDERCSAYIVGTHCFYIDDNLANKVKGVISEHLKDDNCDVYSDSLDKVDNWILNSKDEILDITKFKQAYLDIVTMV